MTYSAQECLNNAQECVRITAVLRRPTHRLGWATYALQQNDPNKLGLGVDPHASERPVAANRDAMAVSLVGGFANTRGGRPCLTQASTVVSLRQVWAHSVAKTKPGGGLNVINQPHTRDPPSAFDCTDRTMREPRANSSLFQTSDDPASESPIRSSDAVFGFLDSDEIASGYPEQDHPRSVTEDCYAGDQQ
jgi:hypothetical protein